MNLADARKRIPELAGLSDESAINVIHEVYYPDMDKGALAERLGFKTAPPPAPERGAVRAVADTALSFGRGAVSGVRMMTDLAGADNAASRGLRSADEALNELQSATAKADQQRVAEIMKEAEDKGFLDQVIAGAKAFGVAPAQMIAQAAGTSLPTLATAMIPGAGPAAVAARMGAAGVMGAAQGAGNVKGVIYEDVKRELLAAGATPEEAEARAVDAQSYGGANAGQIAAGGALGAVAGSTGMERTVSALRNGVTQAAPGMLARVGMGAVTEAAPEVLQGGQEKLASNLALGNEGFAVDPMAGVVAGGTMEGLAGAAMGGVTGIPNPSVEQPALDPAKAAGDAVRAAEAVPEMGPMTRAANVATEVKAQAVEQGLSDQLGQSLTGTAPADLMGAAENPLVENGRAIVAERQSVARTDAALAQMERTAARDLGRMREFDARPARAETQDPFADVPVSGGAPGAAAQPGDVLNPKGEPFKTKMAAQRAAKQTPGEVLPVAGGFVVRPVQQEIGLDAPEAAADATPGQALDAGPAGAMEAGAGPGAAAGQVGDGTPVVDGQPEPAPALNLKPGEDWQTFPPDTGSLNLPRAEMPQVKGEHRGAMVNFLNARGVEHEADEVAADTLKPTQAEFSLSKVQKAREFADADRSILVSGDGYVVDGHHQWIARGSKGETVKVIRLKAPIADLLPLVREFPSSTVDETTANVQNAAPAVQGEEAQAAAVETPAPAGGDGAAAAGVSDAGRAGDAQADGVTLYRGVPAGSTERKTVGGALFMSPDRAVAEAYAGKDGVVSEQTRSFKKLLQAPTWMAAKESLGLPRSASMEDLVNAARAAGHDGVTFVTTNKREYIAIDDALVETPAKKLPYVSKEEGEHLFGVDVKRKAAIDRIAKGTAYFGTAEKAKDFITKNGLKETHEAIPVKPGRIEVRAKGEAAAAPAPAPAPGSRVYNEDGSYYNAPKETAVARRNRLIAEREQAQAPAAPREFVDEAPNGIKVGERALVTPKDGRGEPFEATVMEIEANARGTTYGGTAFHMVKDDATPDGRGTGWYGIQSVNPLPDKTAKKPATPQVPNEPGAKYVLPSFVTKTAAAPAPPRPPATTRVAEDSTAVSAPPAAPAVTANKIFTEDAAAAARAVLKRKLGTLNSGIDPELMQAGMTLAGYHIEKGARTFAAFARAMVADLGAGVAPYLKSWYMGVKYDPRATAFEGMDSAATVESADVEVLAAPAPVSADVSAADRKKAREVGSDVAAGLFDWASKASTKSQVETAILDSLAASNPNAGDLGELAATIRAELEQPAKQADTGDKENGNAAQQLDSPSAGALEGAPASDVRAPVEGGDAGAGPDRSGRGDGDGDARPDDAGGDTGRGVGGNARAVPVPARGTRADSPDAKKRGVPRAPRTESGDVQPGPAGGLTPDTGANPAPNAPAIAAPQPSALDFTITDELALGEGGQKTKFKNNVAAIRLMQDLEATGRMATPDEQAVLAKYVGWGGLPQAFDAGNADWAKEHAEVIALMSPEERAAARQSTRYAHYTSREIVVDGIYAAMRHFGFTGGKTLEAGAGVGNFIGLMPADMRSAGRFTAIEREPFSSAIARQLYPQQSVQRADFTEFKGTDAYYDAAVGNPPFASDPQTDRSGRKHLSGLSLHNYFFAKSIDMLREGGIMAQVVTNSFMDAKGDKARKYISDRVELLGAIRLPNSAFAKNANTEVTTDLIFFKKRPDSEVGGKAARADAKRWLNTGVYTDARGKQVALNQYFIDNPGMMLGDFGAYGTMYGPNQPALVARDGQDTLAMLKEAVGKLPAGVYKSIADTGTDSLVSAAVVALKNPSVKEGGYFVEDGKLMQRLPDLAGEARGVEVTAATQWTEKTALGESGVERIKALAGMRATVRGLLAAEMSDDAKGMKALRATLNEQYDAYRDTHGLINDPSTLRVFDDDPDFPLLASLEHGYTPGIGPAAAKRLGVKPTKSTAKKGPIFTQRVVAARQTVQKVETPADALAVSMAERGRLDAAYIGTLLGMEPEQVLRELSTGDKPLLFRDPVTDEYVLRDAYLSGNVRAKLAQAKQAGMFVNINALEAVQPEDVGSHEIVARLGSPWVPTKVYSEFAEALFGEESKASVFYLAANSSYQVSVKGASSVALSNTWGTPEYSGDALVQALMNNRSIKVTYIDAEKKTRTDVDATERANTKAQEIKERFNDWLFSDSDRSELLTKAYNETNNNYVTRIYDGSHMTFPGKVPDSIIKFRRHQRNAIARIVQDRTTLLDHVVGAGKTFTVVSGAMELKRTGLARKPMVAVPNHLVKQWAADFYRLYPGANVLTATKKDFEKANRRKFLARIATGDWDAVVIAHSSFGFIKPAPEFEAEFNSREIQKIMATIQSVDEGDGDKPTKRRTVKQLEAMKERLENRIKALRDKPMDDLLDFEQIGVDQLFVDEAHMFKNLMFSTKMQGVAGLNDPSGSQRAYDMYVKTNQVMEKNGRGQGVVFATGTPVSNSLAEMYHMMRYLMPTQMRELGFESFDAWANTYASVEQVWMQAPSGDGFKAQNRMSNFVNTPELLKMFDQVSDTVTMDDIKKAYAEENNGAEFPLPKLKGGRRTPVSLDKSPAQDAYMVAIAARAKAIESRRGPPKKGDDNILVVMSDARKAAMDIRLVDPDATEREPGGRIDRATDEVVARYQKYDSVKGTQLVFSDLGTPIKHAKKELAEYEALQGRVLAGSEDVAASATLGNEAAMGIMEDAEAAQAEIEAMGPDWLSAVKAALRGFSIYDDFKAALIEKGMPEAEIAFIHDYNTDDQKASLFRKVNAGQIRVLLGSTAKLGAGTNVQERLVAEHHLDVPWRPSDVEQREGRIERQGNRLMTEWPDFEIEILAYVTRDTLDMRMWQVQEAKLKMINQLRTRKVGREIDNAFEDMELSAGEMQAAATGDINLLKEIQLRNDVKKLEQRRRSFDGQRNDLISRKRRNAEALRDLPKQAEEAGVEAKFAEQYRSDLHANKPAFAMNIDGKDYTDAREAQLVLRELDDATEEVKALNGEVTTKKAPLSVTINGEPVKNRAIMAEMFASVRGDVDLIAWDVGGEVYRRRSVLANAIRGRVLNAIADENVQQVGTLGPYSVAVEGSTDKGGAQMLEVTLRRGGNVVMSNSIWAGDTNNAPAQVIRQAENLLESAVREADYFERSLARARKDAADLEKVEIAGDWPDQGKLDAARAAHKEILALLKQKEPVAAPDAGDAPAAFSRGDGSPGVTKKTATEVVQAIRGKWANAPEVVVVDSMQDEDVPAAVREHDLQQRSVGAAGEPEGFWYGGKAYIVAGALKRPADVARVLFHEALGHYGLRGTFGEDLVPILKQLAALRRGEVEAKAKQYGLDMTNEQQRLQAAEEVLAEMAQATPELGFVRRVVATVRAWLRKHVPAFSSMKLTDADIIANYILPARQFVERGPRAAAERGAEPSMAFSKAELSVLDEISRMDGMFAVPKSRQTTLEGIFAELAPQIKVKRGATTGVLTSYKLTIPADQAGGSPMVAEVTVRAPNPYGESVYGMTFDDQNQIMEATTVRAGENPDDVSPDIEDVWIDVSKLPAGAKMGEVIYSAAANFAHNTGRIFIGDPNGLSPVALRRRTEQMISSALKFGTTEHLAPHPDQVKGDRAEGVPTLKWVYGDHQGNIERMIDVSLKAIENAFPSAKLIGYDAASNKFFRTDTLQRFAGRGQLASMVGSAVTKRLGVDGGKGSTGSAGWRTVARAALFRHLREAQGLAAGGTDGRSLLDRLREVGAGLGREGADGVGGAAQEPIFYSRSSEGGSDRLSADAEGARFSRSLTESLNNVRDVALPSGYVVNDLFQSSGKLSWWNKTVGTMYNLAQRERDFKPVFDKAQEFLNDVSYYAAEAANLAPKILPKLETLKDIAKSPISAEDNKAIAAPIFEGTLTWMRDPSTRKPVTMAEAEARAAALSTDQKASELLRKNLIAPGVLKMWQGMPIDQYTAMIEGKYERELLQAGIVWTDAELKGQFNLSDEQVGLFREFRAATDKSLATLAIADMVRFGGQDVVPVRELALEQKTVDAGAKVLRDFLLSQADADTQRRDVLTDTADRMLEKAAKARSLMDRGYAPLSRFGRYSLDVVDAEGERVYFGLFESQAQANKMARQMRSNFPGAQVTQGTVSQEAYKMFAGVSPETLELFGQLVGLEAQGDGASNQVFQTYLKNAKSQRSAMKRLIQRKGIAGFSEDPGRVLAGFVYSNARQTSSSLHMGELATAVEAIPKTKGELKDMAVKLNDYVKNPQEEAQALRGLLFAQYLGGSVSSALLNALQPVQVTFPWLSQHGGAIKAASRLKSAMADVLGRSELEPALAKALKKAEEDGVVSPQEVFQLQAQAAGRAPLLSGDGTRMGDAAAAANNTLSRVTLAWGKLFGAAEQFNRRTTFIAAYRTAVEQRIPNPAAFAEKAVYETQFVYCVDTETECLTTTGWKKRDALRAGDVVIGVDEGGRAIETPLLALHRFDGRQAVTEFSNASKFSMVVTSGHDCLVQNYNSRDKKWQRLMKRKTADLKGSHHLLRAPLASIERPDTIGADFAALLGWVAAEGNYAKFRNCTARTNVRITQSLKHNPLYVAEIEGLLVRLGGHFKKFVVKSGEMVTFTLKRPISDMVRAAMPEKLLTWQMVGTMSALEMSAVLDAFAKGDGHKIEEGGWLIAQKEEQNLHVLHAMAAMIGANATMYPAQDKDRGQVAQLYLHTNTKRTMVKQLQREDVFVDDGVWCPETVAGTWIARRNGAIFVTGNSKANRPQWARGAVGATVFTFKQYSISYVELMHRMYTQGGPEGKKAALLGIAVLFLMSGLGGMPFNDDFEDLIDGFMQRVMNRNFSTKQAKREFFAGLLGADGAAFLERGISGLPGVPVDVSGRLGLGNMIPGTGVFQKKDDYSRDLIEIVGPAGDLAKRSGQAAGKALQGEVLGARGALATLSPVAARNAIKGWEMATTGMYLDDRGRKVLDSNGMDAMFKSIGIQPAGVAQVQESVFEVQRQISLNKIRESEIAGKWAMGVFRKDADLVREARSDLAAWNRDNPSTPIVIKMPQIIKRVRQMSLNKTERIAKTAPAEIRTQVRDELREAQR